MEQETQMLVERLDRLEQENFRIKRSARLTKIMLASMSAMFAAVASVPLALSKPPAGVPVVNAQQINLVNTSGQVLAALGPTSDGNVLTFFDNAGKKTLTLGNNPQENLSGIAFWDGNSIIPGTGKVRVIVGEGNPTAGPKAGFGTTIYDGSGLLRTAFGPSYDLTFNGMIAIDPDGTSTGVDIFQPTSSEGFFANDANGVTRTFVGKSLDSTSFNGTFLYDANNSNRLWMGDFQNESSLTFGMTDSTGQARAFGGFDQFGPRLLTLNAAGTVTGHLP